MSIYDQGLDKCAANYAPLTPSTFLQRAARVYAHRVAVVHGDLERDYASLYSRSRALASALAQQGVGEGDTVSVIAPNTPEMLELHFGVPMSQGVLNTINTRLDPAAVAFMMDFAEAKVLFVDRAYAQLAKDSLTQMKSQPLVIGIDDDLEPEGEVIGEMDYEEFLSTGDPEFDWQEPADEWQAISLNFTSGTTGNPKGVVYHHRGAYLNAMSAIIAFNLGASPSYLWTVPMFHCNGWCCPWAVTAAGGTHVCLRKVDPALIYELINRHSVSHMGGAPTVLNMILNAPETVRRELPAQGVSISTGGAAPPSAVIAGMQKLGFHVAHLYGLTEVYGPSHWCEWQTEWDDLDDRGQMLKMARQGVPCLTINDHCVLNTETGEVVPEDGQTIGELVMRGNTVMKGYLKNPAATEEAFAGGWFHSGDLAVMHPDYYAEIKDRSKDIIISGGENISSLEVEELLYQHPDVMEAAVVARPDDNWGETPCAFVCLKTQSDGSLTETTLIEWCRERMAHFKCPKTVVFGPLPKTSTGKIQKFVLRERAEQLDTL
ncbi:MAG: acyl-CoA synthetase [Planctomycetaceae bacterium]|nr:acyl-CoA synthetase [Planctomycetaceae bacterium]